MIISRGVGGLSAGEKLHAKLTQAGVGPTRLEKQGAAPASSVKQDRDGVVVTLSIDPKAINALIQKQEDKVNLKSAADFRDFLKRFHDELRDAKKDSKMLNELPESSDPARLSLAKQAANYILKTSDEPLAYGDVSAKNPFSELGRKTLSNIAFDDSGAYTSAERFVAFAEIEHRDQEFGKKITEQIATMSRKDESRSTLWTRLIQSNAHATLLSEMSETERAFRGFGTEASERAIAAALKLETNGVSPPELPEYQNLREAKDSVLAAVTDTQGLVAWKMISVKQLAADSTRLELIEFVSASKDATAEKNPPQEATAASKAPANPVSQAKASRWLSLYATIGAY